MSKKAVLIYIPSRFGCLRIDVDSNENSNFTPDKNYFLEELAAQNTKMEIYTCWNGPTNDYFLRSADCEESDCSEI